METNKLSKWANLLLDTGKGNNLINFKNTKSSTVEIIYPSFETMFSKIDHSISFEVYNSYNDEEEDDNTYKESDDSSKRCISKEEYLRLYERKLKKNSQILIYNSFSNAISALENIGKKAKTTIEEKGVNIAYMAFGFINWTEDDNSKIVMSAPILLVPISIENESSVDPYYIKITDNEIITNPTFFYKLKNEHGITIPEYDDEDINVYLDKVEKYVSKLKWNVTRECKVGLFSFLKINMYNDLTENASTILENNNVLCLLGEEVNDYSSSSSEDNLTIDDVSDQLFNVVDADSSQIEAIKMARSGKNFVLQGPPGTGKSQTITNIISDCIANGKKVLFVSEKLAALNVVYDKLKKAGLDEFCLQLHSHKANKKEVIDDLYHTLKTNKSTLSNRAQKEITLKADAQEKLSEYEYELHKTRPIINKSLYELYEEVSSCRKAPIIDFVINDIKNKNEKYINTAISSLHQYCDFIPSIGYDYHNNIWYGYVYLDYSYQTISQIKIDLKNCISICSDIKRINEILNDLYSMSIQNINQFYNLRDFFNLIKTSDFITHTLLDTTILNDTIETVALMKDLSTDLIRYKEMIDKLFDNEIYDFNGEKTYKKLTRQYNKILLRIFSKEYRQITKSLKLCSLNGKKVKYKDAVSIMNNLMIYQQKNNSFMELEKQVIDNIGIAYKGVFTDFDKLIKELDLLARIQQSRINFASMKNLSKKEYKDNLNKFNELSDLFNDTVAKYGESEQNIYNKFDINEINLHSLEVDKLQEKYQGCINNIDKLGNWCEFVKLLNTLSELEIRSYVDIIISNEIGQEFICDSYKKAFYAQWIDTLILESPIINLLSRNLHDDIVKTFKSKDEIIFEINKAKIKEIVSGQKPDLNMIAPGSASSILMREGEKKRKQKNIRVLLDEIGDLAQTLKPCFLMSPLSVSTYLNHTMKFDVVIFDEASQIFPQDAIGAIYRSKQLIVVGDSKQMPPSNFFNNTYTQDDNEEDDDVTDFESILDICSTCFQQIRLKWHYRSRYEQLISFSNRNFYDNELITFPSNKHDEKGIGVDYYYVNGIFDRKSKTNRIEAEKIVELVFSNIKNYPDRSIGVVAFSISQQNLIESLIRMHRKQHPEYETFFKSDNAEPFFVKNLETVQGDERDTIIFSIAYGKDIDGRLLLNFGPVIHNGGERRLNVAFTRAKYNVQLVTSMHYYDIDLSRINSVGGRLLREYLDYAENGQIALERKLKVNSFDSFDSEFEMEVCEFLRENGYTVDTQVGCSSFRIDLALKHPETSNYVLAIECDGASYHSSRSVRDRDRLRQQILERMGWKFYRIWSTDWFRNKRIEQERLLKAASSSINEIEFQSKKEQSRSNVEIFEEEKKTPDFEFPTYIMVNEYNIASINKYNIMDTIIAIVKVESPIAEEWLLKRILFLFNREKITSAVREEYNHLAQFFFKYGITRKNGFLYLNQKEIPMLRVPTKNSKAIRNIKYISIEELALGMKEIIKQNIVVTKDGLFKLLVQQLGFSHIGDNIEERLEQTLHYISKDIEIKNNVISLKV